MTMTVIIEKLFMPHLGGFSQNGSHITK